MCYEYISEISDCSVAIMATCQDITFPLPESTFSEPFRDKYISEVVRVGSIIISHLSKLKPSSPYCVMLYF